MPPSASQSHGSALVKFNYLADDRFRANCGVRSLSSRESMYSRAFDLESKQLARPDLDCRKLFCLERIAGIRLHKRGGGTGIKDYKTPGKRFCRKSIVE